MFSNDMEAFARIAVTAGTHHAFHGTPQFETYVRRFADPWRHLLELGDVLSGPCTLGKWGQWSRVSQPVLVICGTDDAGNLAGGEHLAVMTPNSELVYFHGIQHTSMVECPLRYRGEVLRFLGRLGWAARPGEDLEIPGTKI